MTCDYKVADQVYFVWRKKVVLLSQLTAWNGKILDQTTKQSFVHTSGKKEMLMMVDKVSYR